MDTSLDCANTRKFYENLRRQMSLRKEENIIVKRGGFLPALLAPLIGTILANFVNK